MPARSQGVGMKAVRTAPNRHASATSISISISMCANCDRPVVPGDRENGINCLTGKSAIGRSGACPALKRKYSYSQPTQISSTSPAVSSLTRGVSRSSRTLGWDAVDAAASGARLRSQGGFGCERSGRRARRTTLMRTAKPCGPGTRCWCQVGEGLSSPTGFEKPLNSPTTVTRQSVAGESTK